MSADVRRSVVLFVECVERGRLATIAAAGVARAFRLRLVLVHLASDPPVFPYGDTRAREIQRRNALRAGRDLLDELQRSIPGVVVEQRVELSGRIAVDALTAVCREERAAVAISVGRARGDAGGCLLELTEYPPPLPVAAVEEPVPITRVRDLDTWIPGLDGVRRSQRMGKPVGRDAVAADRALACVGCVPRAGFELSDASFPADDPSPVRSWDVPRCP